MQDRHGFIWFATYGGLNKYDGYSFTVFHHDKENSTSMTIEGITRLLEDDEGYIWIIR